MSSSTDAAFETAPTERRPFADLNAARLRELLAFEAPYVAEKLYENKTVESVAEGQVLFEEAKKYLWLIATDRERGYPVPSLRVDEAWHQFILFTSECREFCQRIFGCIMHHAPPTREAPGEAEKTQEIVTREGFALRYREVFGVELPDAWDDERAVLPRQRLVVNELLGATHVRYQAKKAELVVGDGDLASVCVRVDDWAAPALDFMLAKGVFYVREIPVLDDDEKVALCKALMRSSVLLCAP